MQFSQEGYDVIHLAYPLPETTSFAEVLHDAEITMTDKGSKSPEWGLITYGLRGHPRCRQDSLMACHPRSRSQARGLCTLLPKRGGCFAWILGQRLGITLFTVSLIMTHRQALMIRKSRVSSSILPGNFLRIYPALGRPS